MFIDFRNCNETRAVPVAFLGLLAALGFLGWVIGRFL
jgi:hypothetical protein